MSKVLSTSLTKHNLRNQEITISLFNKDKSKRVKFYENDKYLFRSSTVYYQKGDLMYSIELSIHLNTQDLYLDITESKISNTNKRKRERCQSNKCKIEISGNVIIIKSILNILSNTCLEYHNFLNDMLETFIDN